MFRELIVHLWTAPGRTVARVWTAMVAAEPVKGWATIFGGMALTVVYVGFGWVIWKGPWLPQHQGEQIQWLGYGMVLGGVLVLVALAAITGMAVNLRAGKDGLNASIDQDEATQLKVTTTTETTVAPGAAPSADGELPLDQRINP